MNSNEKNQPKSISGFITKRDDEGYKNLYGKVLIVAGNEMYGGAGILAAQGAVYSGAGLKRLQAIRKSSALHARLPECMVLDWTNHDELVRLLPTFDTVSLGPGLALTESLSTNGDCFKWSQERTHLIIDGDGITLYAKEIYLNRLLLYFSLRMLVNGSV